MKKENRLSDLRRTARQYAEIDDYISSGQNAKDIESNKSSTNGFIKLVREYAIQKKRFSVFDAVETETEEISKIEK